MINLNSNQISPNFGTTQRITKDSSLDIKNKVPIVTDSDISMTISDFVFHSSKREFFTMPYIK